MNTGIKILDKNPFHEILEEVREQRKTNSFIEQYTSFKPWITWILISINIAVYGIMIVGGVDAFDPEAIDLVTWQGLFGPKFLEGETWRLITPVFVHGGILHLLFNMLALFNIGKLLEMVFGRGKYLTVYLFAGIAGNFAGLWTHPGTVGVGASGAIFGIYGAFVVYLLLYRASLPKQIQKSLLNNSAAFVVYNIAFGFTSTQIDNAAHLAGLTGGILFTLLLERVGKNTMMQELEAKYTLKQILITLGLFFSFALFILPTNSFIDGKQDFITFEEEFDTIAEDYDVVMESFSTIARQWQKELTPISELRDVYPKYVLEPFDANVIQPINQWKNLNRNTSEFHSSFSDLVLAQQKFLEEFELVLNGKENLATLNELKRRVEKVEQDFLSSDN